MAARKQIIALGGGGFSMEASPLLDDYILASSGAARPRVCFVPTASGDAEGYVARFYRAFAPRPCEPSHLELFRRDGASPADLLLSQDVIYVGGGNTANMLALWRLHGVDQALARAWEQGTVLAGVSAGAVCWFEGGTTDSFGPELAALGDALGLVPGSMCPHYDGEAARRPRYHELIRSGRLPPGHAADDGVALHFIDRELHRAVSSRSGAKGYALEARAGEIVEAELAVELLGADAPGPADP